MKIYLVRHTSVDVPEGYTYGQTDVALKNTFETEAEAVKNNLSGLAFDKVWCSPLTRCVRLADYCGYPDAVRDDRIKELNFGEWEMKSWDELNADPRSEEWFANWMTTPAPGGESFSDQHVRVAAFLDEVRESHYQQVCVFAHGGVLTNARVYAGEYVLERAFENMPSYGEIIELKF
ncbi:MAG: alpha-ribazole phosphatase [Tannerellaceae bacterium]|jgi:alpha-ribazole phosphatase|nr:alpha-ribazole phosphatase [Tannerellaceae bacterium]